MVAKSFYSGQVGEMPSDYGSLFGLSRKPWLDVSFILDGKLEELSEKSLPHPFKYFLEKAEEKSSQKKTKLDSLLMIPPSTQLLSFPRDIRKSFIELNPGRQMIGSFHPQHGNWFETAYSRLPATAS